MHGFSGKRKQWFNLMIIKYQFSEANYYRYYTRIKLSNHWFSPNRWKSTCLNKSRWIQLQFATNRIKIGQLKHEMQPDKCAQRHYVTWRHRIAAGNNLPSNTLQFLFWLWKTILKTHKKFQALSYHTDVVRGGSLSLNPWRSVVVL